jgi:hypothetical protein
VFDKCECAHILHIGSDSSAPLLRRLRKQDPCRLGGRRTGMEACAGAAGADPAKHDGSKTVPKNVRTATWRAGSRRWPGPYCAVVRSSRMHDWANKCCPNTLALGLGEKAAVEAGAAATQIRGAGEGYDEGAHSHDGCICSGCSKQQQHYRWLPTSAET